MAGRGRAQQDLTLLDVLNPYKFTAVQLSNGHFYITTKYIGDTTKQLIYVEKEGGFKPVNYTSHVHFKIDDKVFQLPFEPNPTTQVPPPDNELKVEGLFRDTLNNIPRINARLLAVLPSSGDSIRFIFTMNPVKRPSGGFIRISVMLESMQGQHSIGVLLLIDTKIGDNDRAPIVTSFGYFDKERQFEKSVQPGLPQFWLALEGSPVNPGLTARGNLVESDLITPDLFMFGNWADYTGNQTIKGLGSFIWKDRDAVDTLPYTDSAVLLVWNEQMLNFAQRKLLASTEIGIVDSLEVVDAGASYGGSGSGGGPGDGIFYARASGCMSFDTISQKSCSDPNYHPYEPDVLQMLFIITNTKDKQFNNIRIKFGQLPVGIKTDPAKNVILPDTLIKETTGVGVLTFFAEPRLYDRTFTIPITLMGNLNDTLGVDEICIFVPGILARDSVEDLDFKLLCPSKKDTLKTNIHLLGIRCRNIEKVYLEGNAGDLNCFKIIPPIPVEIPAHGFVPVNIEFQPSGLGPFSVKIIAEVKDFDGFPGGDTVIVRDTSDIKGVGKDEEFALAKLGDTLNFGKICVGDTLIQEWPILNLGGCDVVINSFQILQSPANQFELANQTSFPLTIPREDIGTIGRAIIRFRPVRSGADTAQLIVRSASQPRLDTLIMIGIGDLPKYDIAEKVIEFDTICPGIDYQYRLNVENKSACVVDLDSIYIVSQSTSFNGTPSKISIASNSNSAIDFTANLNGLGEHTGKLFIRTVAGTDSSISLHAIVATRILSVDTPKDYGDVRLGLKDTLDCVVNSTGTAGVEISRIRIMGVHQSDFEILLPNGVNYPIYLQPGAQFPFKVIFSPQDIESREAYVFFEMNAAKICSEPGKIELKGRGVRPLIDIQRNAIYLGDVCVGASVDSSVTLRNFGNGALNITGIEQSGISDFVLKSAFPFVIDSNGSKVIQFSFTPKKLGSLEARIFFNSDGDWAVKPDTLRLFGNGIICANVWIDTIHAKVGERIKIPVHIQTDSNLTINADDIAGLMMNSDKKSIAFSIGHDEKLARFTGNSLTEGMLAGNEQITVLRDSILVNNINNSALKSSNLVGNPEAEVLLGDKFETPLRLNVIDFANGYSRLNIRNGLLIPEYCSIDKRLVNTSGPINLVQILEKQSSPDYILQFVSAEDTYGRIVIYDYLGKASMFIFNGDLKKGLNEFEFDSSSMNDGAYRISVMTSKGVFSSGFVIVK